MVHRGSDPVSGPSNEFYSNFPFTAHQMWLWKPEFDSRIGHHVNNWVLSEWVHAAGSWYNSTLMSCEGKVAVEFVGWT